MKGFQHILLAAVLATCSLQAVELRNSFPRHLTDGDNARLAKFFGHEPKNNLRATLYSDPTSKEGLFFVGELDCEVRDLPEGTSARLETLFEGDKTPRVVDFDLTSVKSSEAKSLFLGLTSPEFFDPKKDPHILAWKISLIGPDGNSIADSASPLWQY
jgi:hypothetical protein